LDAAPEAAQGWLIVFLLYQARLAAGRR